MKKEMNYDGINVVFDNPQRKLDQKRILMLNMFMLYASMIDKEIKVVFFHGEDGEEGISCYWKRSKE
jgi:hypothetical protein